MTFKNIPLTSIVPDPNQPRKFFDIAKVEELAADIKSNEVHTPITVRRVQGTDLYMLVVGERRYKASEIAGKKTIPAIIRTLTDDEAFNIQLSENLNREDVHPLEEGLAFARLMQPGVTYQEIADRFGRSVAFVHKRAQLAKLVDEAQQLFFSGKIDIKDSMALSRLDETDQRQILKESAPNYHHNVSWMCSNATNRLSKAMFKLNDAKLYPEAGACNKCLYNSANAPTLFDDEKEKVCTRPSCFAIKTQKAYRQLLQKQVIEGGKLAIVTSIYLDNDEKKFLEIAGEMGIEPVNKKLYEKVYEPVKPEPLESFEEFADIHDFDLTNPAEERAARLDYADAERDYLKELENYNKELLAYEEGEPLERQAIVIAGYNMGDEMRVRLKPHVMAETTIHNQGAPAGTADDVVIAEILEKEHAAEAKDAMNFYKRLRDVALQGPLPEDMMPPVPGEYYSMEDWLSSGTRSNPLVLAMILYNKLGWQQKDRVRLLLTGSTESADEELLQAMRFDESNSLNTCIRHFMADNLFPIYGNSETWMHKASEEWMAVFMPTMLDQEKEMHRAVVSGRKEKVQKRIGGIRRKAEKALQNELSENT